MPAPFTQIQKRGQVSSPPLDAEFYQQLKSISGMTGSN